MFKRIVLAVDLNHESSWKKALPAAVTIARATGAELDIAMVMPDLHMPLIASYFPPDFESNTREELVRQLAAFVTKEVPADVKAGHQVLSGGRIYTRIIDFAEEISADLIVMAAYRPDLKDMLLGPNADRVVSHARQSVLVVRD